MIGTKVASDTPAWHVAARDAGLVFFATLISSIVAGVPESWADMIEFTHIGVPLLTALQVGIYSLIYNYKVYVPAKE